MLGEPVLTLSASKEVEKTAAGIFPLTRPADFNAALSNRFLAGVFLSYLSLINHQS